MLLKLIHRIVTLPWVYDATQKIAGVEKVYARIRPQLAAVGGGLLLDVGGGTGTLRNMCQPDCRYICLDIEREKLEGLRAKYPLLPAIWGDGTNLPIASASLDALVCMFVAHHLPDDLLDRALNEAHRVLRPGGRMILLDPVYDPARLIGLLLWKMDRGSHPRTTAILRPLLEQRFALLHWEEFAVLHHYVLGVGVKS